MEKISIRQSNKGFTLVEIAVTMVIFAILATVTTLGLISWREYSMYRTQTDNSEMIYMAAKNKITKLTANGVLGEYANWGSKYNFSSETVKNIEYPNKGTRQVYVTYCNIGDYISYSSNPSSFLNQSVNQRKNVPLLFDLLDEYISDKGILNGSIAIEYDESGEIYAVFFSNRSDFDYSSINGNTINISNNANRKEDKLYDKLIGAYIPE